LDTISLARPNSCDRGGFPARGRHGWQELSKRGKRVLILERGGNCALKENLTWRRPPCLECCFSERQPRHGPEPSRREVHGRLSCGRRSSPLENYLRWNRPFRELDDAKRELPLAELPDELLRPHSIRLRESATALGTHGHQSMLVDQAKCANGYSHAAKWTARSSCEKPSRTARR